jgi:hypothetical protein
VESLVSIGFAEPRKGDNSEAYRITYRRLPEKNELEFFVRKMYSKSEFKKGRPTHVSDIRRWLEP